MTSSHLLYKVLSFLYVREKRLIGQYITRLRIQVRIKVLADGRLVL